MAVAGGPAFRLSLSVSFCVENTRTTRGPLNDWEVCWLGAKLGPDLLARRAFTGVLTFLPTAADETVGFPVFTRLLLRRFFALGGWGLGGLPGQTRLISDRTICTDRRRGPLSTLRPESTTPCASVFRGVAYLRPGIRGGLRSASCSAFVR